MSSILDRKLTLVIAEHCESLASGESQPVSISNGLCHDLHRRFSVDLTSLVDFSKYPDFSGDKNYPVPQPKDYDFPESFPNLDDWTLPELYYSLADNDDMWNPDTEYGTNRLKFVTWVAQELRGMLS